MKRELYMAVLGIGLLTACDIPKAGTPEWFETAGENIRSSVTLYGGSVEKCT